MKQGITLMGRNRSGPPCSVGRLTAYAPGGGRPPMCPARPAGSVTDDDDRRQQAKPYWPIKLASNKHRQKQNRTKEYCIHIHVSYFKQLKVSESN